MSLLLAVFLYFPASIAGQPNGIVPPRAAIISAAADIIQKARYCTFITIDQDGQPQARMVDPLAPDSAFTIWIATNPLTRKVDQIRRNPRVTLSCFDTASSSYVTVLGRGELIADVAEKQRHWKADWSQIYPAGARGNDVVLIKLTPSRLEIVSESRGMVGDAKTWLPLSIDFPPQSMVEEGYVEGADGVRLFYRKIGSSGPPVIVLHGGPGSNMNGVWPDLQPLGEGRTVIMYDQRGGGRSQIIKDAAQLTATHHVRDLEALRGRLGLERFTLIGESWGSGLAVLYAAQHPQRVERLVLIGPMPPSRAIMNRRLDESSEAMGLRRRLAEMTERMPTSLDPIATCREFFSEYSKQFFADPSAIARRRGSSCDGPPEGVRNYFVVNGATLSSLGDFDFRPILGKLTMPALVVEGDKSIPSTIESARVFAQSLPKATLALIEGAGHYPQVEQPDRFFPVVTRFLTAQ